ncbi:MAG: efflux RND transporter periplasmic adaptor subunit [bacterium]|nr:MAG: efflux RND transporter periplasmic adaptor subunit [bacterium]
MKRTWVIAGGGVVLVVVLLSIVIPKSIDIATAEVQRGEFIIDLQTKGEIDALNSTNISVPRFGRRMMLQIVDMTDEGTKVKEGDFLVQLDRSEAEQNVEEAQAALENAKAQLASERATIASNMAQLESQLEIQKYNYEQARLSLKMMEFEAESKKREYELNMKSAEVALEQAGERIESQKLIDKATIMKAELEVRQAEIKLRDVENALDKLTIRAPKDGLVVYKKIWSAAGMKKVQVGDSPWPGMPIIGIPDLSLMQAVTIVNEVDISRIEKGQNVIITVDAVEGRVYYGKISRVAPLARREETTNVKVFDIAVTIDSTDAQLLPGMTCQCQIITGRIRDVVSIPLQAVFQKEGRTVVYVMGPRSYKLREVEVGAKNNDRIVVVEGLEEGEHVCLRDPTVPLEEIGGEVEATASQPKSKSKSRSVQRVIISN